MDERQRIHRRVWWVLHEMVAHVSHVPSLVEKEEYRQFCSKAAEVFAAMAADTLTFELAEELNVLGGIVHLSDPA